MCARVVESLELAHNLEMCVGRVHKSLCTSQHLHALHADECASLVVDHEVQGAATKEEDENKVLFSGLLEVSR